MKFPPIEIPCDPEVYPWIFYKMDFLKDHIKHMRKSVPQDMNIFEVYSIGLKDINKIINDRLLDKGYFDNTCFREGPEGEPGVYSWYIGRYKPISYVGLKKLASDGIMSAQYLMSVIASLKLDFYCAGIKYGRDPLEEPPINTPEDEKICEFAQRLLFYDRHAYFDSRISFYYDIPNTFCYVGFDFEKTKQEIEDEDFDSGDETCEAFFPIDKFYDEDQIACLS